MNRLSYKVVTTEKELEGAFAVRRRVFIEEQGIPTDEEYDGLDGEALHVVATDGQKVIGTARVRFLSTRQAKIERMAILRPHRRSGVGRGILSLLTEELRNRQVQRVVLHAQYTATDFYRSCGFEEWGSPFWEAGIKHVKMERQLQD